ncbi:NlpC/P60 family protein [Flavobacterium sp. TMP13]|uniref:C40 family peptidase n=1 Tax=Flavobacterium sp. TMP13 TaxID=3425950 RepID=UPI003D7845D3
MMGFKLFLGLFFCSILAFSQEKYTKHVISKGESVYQIAKKYNVKPQEILDANPKTSAVLKLNSVLLIPNLANTVIAVSEAKKTSIHEVQQKQTLYGIAKEYNVSVADLQKANPLIESENLKAGQELIIPNQENKSVAEIPQLTKPQISNKSAASKLEAVLDTPIAAEPAIVKSFTHEVLPKETKYGIARQYGISVAELDKLNPGVKNALRVGQKVSIVTSKEVQIPTQDSPNKINAFQVLAENDNVIKDANSSMYTYDGDFVNQLISTASDNIGTRYRTGGTSKSGFDCSGLMMTTFGNFDIKLPRTSVEQSHYGTKIDSDEAQKGDLIFFKTNGRRQINHVGMVVEVNDGEIKFIHASVSSGVIISSTKESYYEKKIAQVNRVLSQRSQIR